MVINNMRKGLFILVKDIFNEHKWMEVSTINLGSMKKPNKEILQVKIIT